MHCERILGEYHITELLQFSKHIKGYLYIWNRKYTPFELYVLIYKGLNNNFVILTNFYTNKKKNKWLFFFFLNSEPTFSNKLKYTIPTSTTI